MRRSLAPSVLLALVASGLVAPAGAVAAPPTCDGLTATVVGPGAGTLTGTSGDDVVVSEGATEVDAGGGDDRICVTGRAEYADVVAGSGDDRISVVGDQDVVADLGLGDDSYAGGPGADRVTENGFQGRQPTSSGRDRISTGAGDDAVSVGAQLRDGATEPMRDEVDLGPGNDTLDVAQAVAAWFSAVAGEGHDTVRLSAPAGPAGWALDNTVGRLTHGSVGSVVSGFEDLDLSMRDASFRGGPASESVSISDPVGAVTLGGGDDSVSLAPRVTEVSVEGGPGDDRLESYLLSRRITLDAARGRLSDDRGVQPTLRLSGFERYSVDAPRRLTFRGTRGSDELIATGCLVRAHGRAGRDHLEIYPSGEDHSCRFRAHFWGGRGRDVLLGARGPSGGRDRLIGGRGHDRADGRTGRDLCRAELRRHCERR